jgi:DNA replicative helicase MCM subunit Mcm2 (Cdc46/Mcm family)
MKIKCEDCGKKIEVDVDDNGIPKKNKCDRCLSRERQRELISEYTGKGKKKRNWWK